ncbi:hypothetical protein EsH8_XI_000122 [Colletotrichum jinshuiense]
MDAAQADEVARLAGDCKDLFSRLLELFKLRSRDHSAFLDNSQRFNAWSRHLEKSDNNPRDTLIEKEKEGQKVRILSTQLLRSIKSNLEHVVNAESTVITGSSKSNQSSLPDIALKPLSEARLNSVQGSIERLQDLALAVAIRSPVNHDVPSNARTSRHGELEDGPISLFLMGILKSRFPRLGDALRARLQMSFRNRRERLLSRRLASQAEELGQPQAVVENRSNSNSEEVSQANTLKDRNAEADDPHYLSEILREDFWSPHQFEKKLIQPPNINEATTSCHCRWCFAKVIIHGTEDAKAWQEHLLIDFEPYFCLSGCSADYPMSFPTFKSWHEHMETVHGDDWALELQHLTFWHCDIPHESTDPAEVAEQERFASVIELERHVRIVHERVSAAQLSSMVKSNVSIAPVEEDVCPFCYHGMLAPATAEEVEHTEKNMTPQPLNHKNHQKHSTITQGAEDAPISGFSAERACDKVIVAMHIAKHLRSLALLSVRDFNEETGPEEEHAHIKDEETESEDQIAMQEGSLEAQISTTPKSLSSKLNLAPGNQETRPTTAQQPEVTLDFDYDEEDVIERLRDAMLSYLCPSQLDSGHSFMPSQSLERLINPKMVRTILNSLNAPNDIKTDESINFICTEAKVFFAVMVLADIDMIGGLQSLQKFSLSDKFLPISRESSRDHCRLSDSVRECKHDKALEAFHYKPWTRFALRQFYEEQWAFLAPDFTTSRFAFDLPPRTILPFTFVGQDRRTGFFSTVYEIKIHPDHQNMFPKVGNEEPRVALKEMWADTDIFEVEEIYKHETKVLGDLRALNNDHIVSAAATILRGEKRFFIFPWADGGNLRDFWDDNPVQLTESVIREFLTQLVNLSFALYELHEENWRHGDLKPENILRFKNNDSTIGILKLADMGLAKRHRQSTELRDKGTQTRMGTLRYEAPETLTSSYGPRSRRYDVWSMGCIVLEFLIWIRMGPDGLRRFNQDLQADDNFTDAFYCVRGGQGTDKTATVHPVVRRWLDNLLSDVAWPVDESCLGDLADLVQKKLLVVALPPQTISLPSQVMATTANTKQPIIKVNDNSDILEEERGDSDSMRRRIAEICVKAEEDPNYLFPERAGLETYPTKGLDTIPDRNSLEIRQSVRIPREEYAIESLKTPGVGETEKGNQSLPQDPAQDLEYTAPTGIDNLWRFLSDEKFAQRVLDSLENSSGVPIPPNPRLALLCDICRQATADMQSREFFCRYEIQYLQKNINDGRCELCPLLYRTTLPLDARHPVLGSTMTLMREDSTIRSYAGGPPLLSLCTDPYSECSFGRPSKFYTSRAVLPPFKSKASFVLLNEWLGFCDEEHTCVSSNSSPRLPKRLLVIENGLTPTVSIQDTIRMNPLTPYTTFSYIRGSEISGALELCLENEGYFADGVDFRKLPRSYQDAVIVTQNLGVKYIWIDALCILQDNPEDKASEISNLETILANSYCMIAATHAATVDSGFLGERPPRAVVHVTQPDGTRMSVCEMIDDFHNHVEKSPLCSQGWNFQERALSRRAIFFTPTQMYFHCGDGVRCETLTKMSSPGLDIIGDPEFPARFLNSYKAPIFQSMYERYTRLELSNARDRGPAILALESRLLRSMKTMGGHGIVERYLGRSLLWRPRIGETLLPIPDTSEPSWSWMAWSGPIQYLDLPYGSINWEPLLSPFPSIQNSPELIRLSAADGKKTVLYAWGKDFPENDIEHLKNTTIIWDQAESKSLHRRLKYVVIGADANKGPIKPEKSRALYILVIGENEDERHWKRLGVGLVEDNDVLHLSDDKVLILIC